MFYHEIHFYEKSRNIWQRRARLSYMVRNSLAFSVLLPCYFFLLDFIPCKIVIRCLLIYICLPTIGKFYFIFLKCKLKNIIFGGIWMIFTTIFGLSFNIMILHSMIFYMWECIILSSTVIITMNPSFYYFWVFHILWKSSCLSCLLLLTFVAMLY